MITYFIISVQVVMTPLYVAPDEPKVAKGFENWLAGLNPDAVVKIWVYFTDKGIHTKTDYETAILRLKNKLTPGARKRRAKVNPELVDFSDLPVCSGYIDELTSLGCSFRGASKWLNAGVFWAKASTIQDIAKKKWVRKIERVRILYGKAPPEKTFDTKEIMYGYSERQLKQIKVDEAHKMGFTGRGVLIGIMDTGFEWRKNRALKETNVLAEYDFIGNDDSTHHQPEQVDTIICAEDTFFHNEPFSQVHHGTGMLCLLGARLSGEAGFVGAAFNSNFALAKTELRWHPQAGHEEDIIAEEDWWIRGVEWVVQVADTLANDSACIISNSLGYKHWDTDCDGVIDSSFAYELLDGKHYQMDIVASQLWRKGVLLVTALGNRRVKHALPETSIVCPASADSVIAVGGVDTLGKWVYWDEDVGVGGITGPRYDGERKPDVCGPWIGFYANPDYTDTLHPVSGGIGTSCATALVAGACALVAEAHPSWSPMRIRKAIMQTASMAGAPNDTLGYGIVNAKKAIGTPDVQREPWDKDRLLAFYPSPFRPGKGELTLPYQLVNNTYACIRIYTLSGRLIWQYETPQAMMEAMGCHEVKWDGKDSNGKFVGSGVYICLLKTTYGSDVRKFAVVR